MGSSRFISDRRELSNVYTVCIGRRGLMKHGALQSNMFIPVMERLSRVAKHGLKAGKSSRASKRSESDELKTSKPSRRDAARPETSDQTQSEAVSKCSGGVFEPHKCKHKTPPDMLALSSAPIPEMLHLHVNPKVVCRTMNF